MRHVAKAGVQAGDPLVRQLSPTDPGGLSGQQPADARVGEDPALERGLEPAVAQRGERRADVARVAVLPALCWWRVRVTAVPPPRGDIPAVRLVRRDEVTDLEHQAVTEAWAVSHGALR